jgi:hypothetical protein
MADIAYVITSGEYSDYRIEAVFLDPDAAGEYANLFGYEVEVFEIGAEAPTHPYAVTCWVRDGVAGQFHYSVSDNSEPRRQDWWMYSEIDYMASRKLVIYGDDRVRITKAMSEWAAETVAHWDVLRYAAELRGEVPPPPEPLTHPDMVRSQRWMCTECGSGPISFDRWQEDGSAETELWKHHAPSCSQWGS